MSLTGVSPFLEFLMGDLILKDTYQCGNDEIPPEPLAGIMHNPG